MHIFSKLTLPIILTIGFLVFNSSCKKLNKIGGTDIDDWDPDLALALINTRTSIQDVLDNFETGGFIEIDNDGFIKLVYQGKLVSVKGQYINPIPDFTIPVLDSSITAQYNFPAGNIISQVDYKTGLLSYSLQSSFSDPVEVVLQFPSATQGGQPLEHSVMLPNSNTVTGSFSLAESSFDFSSNDFPIRYVATRQSNSQRVLLDNAEVTFTGLDYSYVEGYIGNYNFDLPLDTVVIDVFKNWREGELYFTDPKVELIIRNSYGVPIRMNVSTLDANTYKGGVISLNAAQLSNIDFAYPSTNEVGQIKTTVITVDNTSNLPDLIRDVPFEFYYELGATSNPDNNTSINSHITDTSAFEVDINVELPLEGWAKDFVMEDTFQLDLSIYEEFDNLDFKLITENGFPAEVKMQLYFEDEFGNVLDSLVHEPEPTILAAAPVDGSGRVTTPVITEVTSSFPEDRYLNIRLNAKRMRLWATFNTTGAGTTPIRIYSDYELAIKLGARGRLNMSEL